MKPQDGWKLGRDSFTKARIYFKDGNARTFYSLDWKSKYAKTRDRELGLKRLRELVQKYGRKAGVIEIYNIAPNELIEQYFEGLLTSNDNKNE